VFHTTAFRQWLNGLLAAKVHPSGNGSQVRFEDLATILRIIATDVTGQQIKVFGTQMTPRVVVADAVAASISIFLFFVPKHLEGTEYVDGGVLSNFPAWIFDDRREEVGPLVPTFGFKLIEEEGPAADLTSFPAFAKQLFSTALSGDAILETRNIENLHVVPLPVQASTFDFDMTDEAKNNLYLQGKEAARDFFVRTVGPRDPHEMRHVLETVPDAMVPLLNPDADQERDFHLRVNVVMPTTPLSRGRLRVYYTYNMDDDADDRLEFKNDEGACGICWQTHKAKTADLEAARKDRRYENDYHMKKYQQALVRPSLKSLLSVPIFHPDRYDANKPDESNEVIGIMNLDSDEDLYTRFQDGEIQKVAAQEAKNVARHLVPS
jgi:NTE family protein